MKTESGSSDAYLSDLLGRMDFMAITPENLKSLDLNRQETKELQEALSSKGLYMGHHDGIIGPMTAFGLLAYSNPAQAQLWLNEEMSRQQTPGRNEIRKLQIALNAQNAQSDTSAEKITVDGIVGRQTANRLADYLIEQKKIVGSDVFDSMMGDKKGALCKALKKYAAPDKLEAIGMKGPQVARHFEDSHGHRHTEGSLLQPVTYQPPQSGLVSGSGLTFSAPVDAPISSNFGIRRGKPHDGIDFAGRAGTAIKAPQAGEVAYAGRSDGYGNAIILNHGHGVFSLYAHLPKSVRKLAVGERFERGEEIAKIGTSGRHRGEHLHFEIMVQRGDKAYVVDPRKVLEQGLDLADDGIQERLIADSKDMMRHQDNESTAFGTRVARKNYDPEPYNRHVMAENPQPTAPGSLSI